MIATQAKVPSFRHAWPRLFLRATAVILVAASISWALHRSMDSLGRTARPAGFGQGVLQGALMPCAMPNLLLGQDVTIYAEHNVGRAYKLGYTVGVNGCGALFFGIFFWRVNRWMKRRQGLGQVDASDTPGTKAAGPNPGGRDF